MGMALKKDVLHACRVAGTEKPVDLAFLSAQTMGDRALENEILSLFLDQSKTLLDQVNSLNSLKDTRWLAHTIKGVARSIGAFRLAEFAEQCEVADAIDTFGLSREIESVCTYIEELQQARR